MHIPFCSRYSLIIYRLPLHFISCTVLRFYVRAHLTHSVRIKTDEFYTALSVDILCKRTEEKKLKKMNLFEMVLLLTIKSIFSAIITCASNFYFGLKSSVYHQHLQNESAAPDRRTEHNNPFASSCRLVHRPSLMSHLLYAHFSHSMSIA